MIPLSPLSCSPIWGAVVVGKVSRPTVTHITLTEYFHFPPVSSQISVETFNTVPLSCCCCWCCCCCVCVLYLFCCGIYTHTENAEVFLGKARCTRTGKLWGCQRRPHGACEESTKETSRACLWIQNRTPPTAAATTGPTEHKHKDTPTTSVAALNRHQCLCKLFPIIPCFIFHLPPTLTLF